MADHQSHVQLRFRGWLATGVLALLVVQQAVSASRVWVAAIVTLSLLLGYAWARALATQVTCRRELRYGWVQVGDLLEEAFTLRNDSPGDPGANLPQSDLQPAPADRGRTPHGFERLAGAGCPAVVDLVGRKAVES